jgi:hypothetical protein
MTTRVPTPVKDCGRHGLDVLFDNSACFVDDDHDQMNYKSELTHKESSSLQLGTKSRSSPPRNLGWRFSDDIDVATAARYSDSTHDDLNADMEAGSRGCDDGALSSRQRPRSPMSISSSVAPIK